MFSTVRALLDDRAATPCGDPFVIAPESGRTLTIACLHQAAKQLAWHLLGLGLGKGAKVAFLMDNSLECAGVLLGSMYGGFVSVPLNPLAGVTQLQHTLRHCDAEVVFTTSEYAELLDAAAITLDRTIKAFVDHPLWNESASLSCPGPLPALSPDDDALVIYTSGSTGQAKGVLNTHRNLLAGARAIAVAHQLTAADRALCVLPLCHKNALSTTFLATLISGGSLVMPGRFSVASFWDWLADWQCTWSALTPTFVAQLVAADSSWGPSFERQNRPSRLRFVRCSSASLARTQQEAFEERFRVPIVEAMGSTEAGPIFCNPAPSLLPAGGSGVRPEKAVATRKLGSPGVACGGEVAINEDGEILVRGPAVMKGYYKDAAATQEVLDAAGWLRTGDLGYLDSDGYAFFVGRAREVINKGGEKIAPREIDEAVARHPAVLEAASVAVPDRYLGQEIAVFVVLKASPHSFPSLLGEEGAGVRGETSAAELRDWCRQHLGALKTPAQIHLCEDLPRGPTGKVLRSQLAERLRVPSIPHPVLVAPVERATVVQAIEKTTAEIWARSLKLETCELQRSFFELGGHSLLAMEILARLRSTYQVDLPSSLFYEYPTVAQQAQLITEKLAAGCRTGLQTRPLEPRTNLEPRSAATHPLSFAQERIWFLEQLHPEEPCYNEPLAAELKGPLHIAALEAALNAIVARHEVLRTSFELVAGRPVQIVHDTRMLPLARVHVGAMSDAELQQLLVNEARRPFDLKTAPLLRATLFERGPQHYVFLSVWHHIISDGYSRGVLFRELSNSYRCFCAGDPYQPLPLPMQYADFAAWQRDCQQNTTRESDLKYWKDQLQGAPESLDLPTDFPRPTIASYAGTRLPLIITAELMHRLRRLSAGAGVSLFTTLVAAFNVLLHRYTGATDILLGMPVANRDRLELEPLIGCVANTLVLRTNLSGDPTFRDLLGRVSTKLAEAHAHRALPFEQLLDTLGLKRELHREPLFQVMINGRTPRLETLELTGNQVAAAPVCSETAKLDLALFLRESANAIHGEIEYRTELFREATINRMLGHLQELLAGIAASPETHLSQLPLLPAHERHQVLVEWNTTVAGYPSDRCVHELFEVQAADTPEATAVQFGRHRLSYAALNQRANQLAHHLRKAGVGPDSLVGICVSSSPDLSVAILGVLKAGAAYVPLDPKLPGERLRRMLEDAQPCVILSQTPHLQSLPAEDNIVCLDRDWPAIAAHECRNPSPTATAANLAYVLFTSGSSGRPKGVAMPHRSLVNLISWQTRHSRLGRGARTLQFTSFSFDVSFQEMFATWCSGGALIVLDEMTRRDFAALLRLIRDEQIERLFLAAVVFAQLAAVAREHKIYPQHLKEIFTAGEPLHITPDIVDLFRHLPDCTLENQYGPTEAHVIVSAFTLTGPPERWPTFPPIGRAIARAALYVLDGNFNPAPIGVPGELCIGGDALARGYYRQPHLTAERFIPDPFSGQPGARLYRTGDQARWLADGQLQFLGRLDQQVKIRGIRIELGEIEVVLRMHPAVKEVVVVCREEGGKRLVAYVVARGCQGVPLTELRGLIKTHLPDYMAPAAYVFVPSLPLTATGKLDRRALPRPESHHQAMSGQTYVPPRSPTEEVVANIWSAVLEYEPVGVHDHFFELGGHSILATHAITRLSVAFQRTLPIRLLFEKPTLEEFSAAVDDLLRTAAGLTHPPLQAVPRGQAFPLSFTQERIFKYSDSRYNVSRVFEIRGPLNVAALQASLSEIVRRHEALRTTFGVRDKRRCQFVAPDVPAPLPVTDLSAAANRHARADQFCREEIVRAFDLTREAPLRTHLVVLGANEFRLVLTLHHIVYNGHSMTILHRELRTLYSAFSKRESSPLPPPSLQLVDVAVWQRRLLDKNGDFWRKQMTFWTEQLGGNLPQLQLPTLRGQAAAAADSCDGRQSFEISAQATAQLAAISRAANATQFMTLLTAFKTLLYCTTGQEDVLIGAYIAGRNHPGLEGLFGDFANLLALRTNLSGNPTFFELLQRVRKVTLDAYTHQDMPFEMLVEELNRRGRRYPVISAIFQFALIVEAQLQLEDLDVTPQTFAPQSMSWGFTLFMHVAHGKLIGHANFDARLHDPSAVRQMLAAFKDLLETIATVPERRLSDLRKTRHAA